MKIKLAKSEIIHFIGIGGIGMSGLSLIMKGKGFKVQGSDIASNKNIERLKKDKIKITIGHKKQNINKATIVVVSSAIKKNNPELIEANKKQLPIYKRGEMLANIVSLTKNIVVVGSHGKTTTTSLIASIFQETKIDPTIINGGVINSIENTYKLSKSKIKKLSDRNFGVGFDQVISIGPPTKDSFDFSIRFFNADGGEASMCLNGIRCAASYVWRNNFAPKKSIIIKTKNRLVICKPVGNKIRVNIKVSDVYKNDSLYKKISGDISHKFDFVDSGNMHLCIKQSSIKNEDINALYKNLTRYIKPLRCNLSIYKVSKDNIDIRTYENGVGETLSCGSASLAVASLCIKDKCRVKSSGGALDFKKKNNDTMEMIGPAEFVFSGSFDD